MIPSNNEWTILEKLLLTQAVYKYGENMWFQVARVLKQHSLIQQQEIQRPSDFYSQKNCSFQYYLLVENLEAEKQTPRNDIKRDMPVVIQLARQLYTQRVEEIKKRLQRDQEEFSQLATEIHSIKSGQWDQKLEQRSNFTSSIEEFGKKNIALTIDTIDKQFKTSMSDDTTEIIEGDDKEVYCKKRAPKESITSISHALKKARLDKPIMTLLNDNKFANHVEKQVVDTAISEVNKPFINNRIKSPDRVHEHITTDEDNPNTKTACDNTAQKASFDKTKEISETISEQVQKIVCSPKEITKQLPDETILSLEDITLENEHINVEKEMLNQKNEYEENNSEHVSNNRVSFKQQYSNDQHDKEILSDELSTPSNCSNSPEIDNQQQKIWRKTISILWQTIANHKNGPLFMKPVKSMDAPLYNKVVKRPLLLNTIKKRVKEGTIKTTCEFERDIILMLTNSLMYNKEGTEAYLLALEMLKDVKEQFEIFKSADISIL